jgi:hypothetical protein
MLVICQDLQVRLAELYWLLLLLLLLLLLGWLSSGQAHLRQLPLLLRKLLLLLLMLLLQHGLVNLHGCRASIRRLVLLLASAAGGNEGERNDARLIARLHQYQRSAVEEQQALVSTLKLTC